MNGINFDKLREPFEAKFVEWRVGQAGVKSDGTVWCKVLAYLANRAIMTRLDTVCGPENWWNEYRPGPQGGIICGITILCGDRPVTKWDGAENTDIEAVKGGLSDSMKRAAVQWGIGRYLYDLEEGWAKVSMERKPGWYRASAKRSKDDRKGVTYYWQPPALPAWALPKTNSASSQELSRDVPQEPKPQPKRQAATKTGNVTATDFYKAAKSKGISAEEGAAIAAQHNMDFSAALKSLA